jgi:hypothetical protein
MTNTNQDIETLRPSNWARYQPVSLSLFVIILHLTCVVALCRKTNAQGLTGNIKGTVSATTGDPSTSQALLAGARLTLINQDLQGKSLRSVTDDAGYFAFVELPAGIYKLTAETEGLPAVTRNIRLTTGATLKVDILLTATVSESVTVRDEEGLLSIGETSTTNTVRSEKLTSLPLRAENYQSALLLTPGVVRTVDGADHLKGTRAGQSAYTVNGADVTDPVTGNLAFDIPVEAAASVQIEENPYGAEFGRFTGGVTNLETKTGGDKFKVQAARFIPTFRNIVTGPIDSFRPRFTFSGPLAPGRLYFVQSFEYRFSRTRVLSLVAPHDDSTLEGFNSFTQLDLAVNKNNRIKFVAAIFPQKVRYVGLDTFDSQATTPNTKQHGELFSLSDQTIFHDESFLSSLVSYKKLQFDVFAQGPQPLTVLPDGKTGNYFAGTRRSSQRLQWQESYYARRFTLGGNHSFKLGTEFDYTTASGTFSFNSILIRRRDQTLSQRIDFTGPGSVSRSFDEFAGFAQDRWAVGKRLTMDWGLRLDHDSVTSRINVAPRFAFMYIPLKDERTIIRGGIGIFDDRTPLSFGYFATAYGDAPSAHFPERIVTTYAADGIMITDGPRHFVNVSSPLRNPRSVRWSLQLDRGLTKLLTVRLGYLQRSTTNEAIIDPPLYSSGVSQLALSSDGRANYRELQALAIFNHEHFGNWTVSYVWSRARGDLNTADNFLGDLPLLVVRPNQFGPLPFETPHRFIAYGEVKTRFDITVSPAVEIRSGFPFSYVNDRLDFIGGRNQAGRFPKFISLDAQILKGFKVPFLDKRARVGVAIFNITRHFNPRDVQNNTGSLQRGQFFNSPGMSVRGKFEFDW